MDMFRGRVPQGGGSYGEDPVPTGSVLVAGEWEQEVGIRGTGGCRRECDGGGKGYEAGGGLIMAGSVSKDKQS